MKRLLAMGGALAAVVALGAGCASAPPLEADRHFLAGDYGPAAAGYEALMAAEGARLPRDLLLYRAAVSHALAAGDPAGDARSAELLRRLVAEFPASPYRPPAELILRLLAAIERAEQRAAEERARTERLLSESEALRREVEGMTDRVGSVEGELGSLEKALADLNGLLGRLREQAAAREEEIANLKKEIELLKAIDLERKPPGEAPP